ncbi:unnamed protein product [Mytilus coruscus]|uniref:Uncharacterized protein n=1 Tax=Mytilus coruscus TaxID=42192 RepID=A0A6J8EL08_MYTCO|nr:unnamed protein product [Mytilus coruscus]
MMEKESKRPPCFKNSLPGDDSKKKSVLDKLQHVRSIVQEMNHPVNNAYILETVLDEFISTHSLDDSETKMENMNLNTYIQVEKKDVDQKFIIEIGHFKVKKLTQKGHVAAIRFTCDKDKHHSVLWSSSPYLPNGEYMVNSRIFHEYECSGMLPVHYNRFSQGANIGHINKSKQSYMFNKYKQFVDEEYNGSIETALMEEVGMYEDWTSIDIMTDERHGWRKNAKDTTDDFVSQRHEKLGTQRIYQYLDDNDVKVGIHSHDRNMSINKFVRDSDVVNQNDSWHGIKAVKSAMKKVSSGPKYLRDKTWSDQLEDKVESVATHFHWAIRNCKQNPKELKDLLNNVVEHYKNNYAKCHPDSRCKTDLNYEPKRIVLTKPIAEKLLLGVIHKSVIFKSPDHFVLARDTSYVESFNNTMNMFQDKRIVLSDANYHTRACLAVCHWNENVDRGFTSIWNPERRNAPRSMKGKKNYKPPSYSYRNNIWKRQINSIYL